LQCVAVSKYDVNRSLSTQICDVMCCSVMGV